MKWRMEWIELKWRMGTPLNRQSWPTIYNEAAEPLSVLRFSLYVFRMLLPKMIWSWWWFSVIHRSIILVDWLTGRQAGGTQARAALWRRALKAAVPAWSQLFRNLYELAERQDWSENLLSRLKLNKFRLYDNETLLPVACRQWQTSIIPLSDYICTNTYYWLHSVHQLSICLDILSALAPPPSCWICDLFHFLHRATCAATSFVLHASTLSQKNNPLKTGDCILKRGAASIRHHSRVMVRAGVTVQVLLVR